MRAEPGSRRFLALEVTLRRRLETRKVDSLGAGTGERGQGQRGAEVSGAL